MTSAASHLMFAEPELHRHVAEALSNPPPGTCAWLRIMVEHSHGVETASIETTAPGMVDVEVWPHVLGLGEPQRTALRRRVEYVLAHLGAPGVCYVVVVH